MPSPRPLRGGWPQLADPPGSRRCPLGGRRRPGLADRPPLRRRPPAGPRLLAGALAWVAPLSCALPVGHRRGISRRHPRLRPGRRVAERADPRWPSGSDRRRRAGIGGRRRLVGRCPRSRTSSSRPPCCPDGAGRVLVRRRGRRWVGRRVAHHAGTGPRRTPVDAGQRLGRDWRPFGPMQPSFPGGGTPLFPGCRGDSRVYTPVGACPCPVEPAQGASRGNGSLSARPPRPLGASSSCSSSSRPWRRRSASSICAAWPRAGRSPLWRRSWPSRSWWRSSPEPGPGGTCATRSAQVVPWRWRPRWRPGNRSPRPGAGRPRWVVGRRVRAYSASVGSMSALVIGALVLTLVGFRGVNHGHTQAYQLFRNPWLSTCQRRAAEQAGITAGHARILGGLQARLPER